MAEILIKVADYIHADPEKDRRGVHKRGDVINIKPDGWSDHPNWAQSSYPYQRTGKFILIKVPDLTVEEALSWRDSWKDDFGYEILGTQPAQGRYTVRVFERNPGVSGQNNLTAVKVQTFLEGWGCTDISFAPNSCQFNFSLWNAVRSPEFWNYPLVGINFGFTLISYSASTGIGRVQADYVAEPIGPKQEEVLSRILERGGTIISAGPQTVTFEIERSNILQHFRDDVKRKAERTYMRHRHAIPQANVDAVISAGGILTMTRAEFLSKLRDKMAE